jgi:hypothetical protein
LLAGDFELLPIAGAMLRQMSFDGVADTDRAAAANRPRCNETKVN